MLALVVMVFLIGVALFFCAVFNIIDESDGESARSSVEKGHDR